MIPLLERSERWFNNEFPFCLRIDTLSGRIQPHGHNFIEFNYTFRGHGVEIINGISHELKPGTLTILFPHQIHEIFPDKDNSIHMYVGGFGLEYFFDDNNSVLSINKLLLNTQYESSSTYYFDQTTANRMNDILAQMNDEIAGNLEWNKEMFKVKLVELFIILDRYRSAQTSKIPSAHINKKKSCIGKIVEYVYKNSHEDITLELLSRIFYLSIPHISTAFKQYIGQNFHDFLEKIRIARACSLLQTTDKPITQIAYEAGFKSYTTFSRVFLDTMGMNPTSYKKLDNYNTPGQ